MSRTGEFHAAHLMARGLTALKETFAGHVESEPWPKSLADLPPGEGGVLRAISAGNRKKGRVGPGWTLE